MRSVEFELALSRRVWDRRYRLDGESSYADTAARVAAAVAAAEPTDAATWSARFRSILAERTFLPGGRILAGAGRGGRRTLCNCFVMGAIDDSMPGIFDALRDGATTLQLGGGIGYDFSTLRPAGTPAYSSGNIATGPVSFMTLWDTMAATVVSGGGRRGAMMATLRCDHPDIRSFIAAKATPGVLSHFNLSVQITSDFLAAVDADAPWPLVFPDPDAPDEISRVWSGSPKPVRCRIDSTAGARTLWRELVEQAWVGGDPGVLFVDRVNALNNLHYREQLSATNPCGEVPLPPWGACTLGSVNLPLFIREPFSPSARLDREALLATVRDAVRFLDNVIDICEFPLPAQAEQAQATRRIGLGLTGLADALCLLNLRYDSEAARAWAGDLMGAIRDAAYAASVELARRKGAFPAFERDAYLDGQFVATLPATLRDAIAADGIRNSHLLAVAPAGSISLLADDVSSGIEPIFAEHYSRRLSTATGSEEHELQPWSLRLWQQNHAGLPPAFVTANEVAPQDHVRMQAALQAAVDGAISKTVRLPAATSVEDVDALLRFADVAGLKGITVFRDRADAPAVLTETCALR